MKKNIWRHVTLKKTIILIEELQCGKSEVVLLVWFEPKM